MLEDKFLATTNYVEINAANFSSFSNEYALLLQSIGVELDNFFKVYCSYNPTDRKNIADYVNFILANCTSITTQQGRVVCTDIELIHFQGWNVAAPAQSLFWWSALDKIKQNYEDKTPLCVRGHQTKLAIPPASVSSRTFKDAKGSRVLTSIKVKNILKIHALRVILYP